MHGRSDVAAPRPLSAVHGPLIRLTRSGHDVQPVCDERSPPRSCRRS